MSSLIPTPRHVCATAVLLVCVAGALVPVTPVAAQAPAAASEAARAIELVLDASGSMNAKLPDGRTKIEAARTAIDAFLNALPSGTRLAFRAYGHQSPREKHDCTDTALLMPFGDAGGIKADIAAKVKTLKGQGYTPITAVLETAAKDFPLLTGKGNRFIVLVSDGKETCDGDPCATAKAMQAAAIGLVIHTIGFDVDKAARTQLECIAHATGGTYFDAPNAEQLAAVIAKAAVQTAMTVTVERAGPGKLAVRGAELHGHEVVDAATAAKVTSISASNATVTLPSGLYNVKFGSTWWKSVEVKAGQTTLLEPAHLHVKGAAYQGHEIIDAETGVTHGKVSSADEIATIMPGTYDVTFGKLVWPGVKVEAGQTVQLLPGRLTVKGLDVHDVPVKTKDGRTAGAVSALASTIVLPAGEYQIQLGGVWRPLTLAEGQTLTISVK